MDDGAESDMGNIDDIGRLIHHVGARETVPAERMERARHNVRSHWQQLVDEHKETRDRAYFSGRAIAASIVLVVGIALVLWGLTYTNSTVSVASVDRVLGEVSVAAVQPVPGGEIERDTVIETGVDSRIALRMSGGQSLRIDTSSQVVVHSPSHVSLTSGALYIDTLPAPGSDPIRVSTPMGTARDIGTQFQVRLTATALVVGVRDGVVEIEQTGVQNLSVGEGRYVELNVHGESAEFLLQENDPNWQWVETVMPEFSIKGVTLQQYLDWFARERGLTLRWEDETSEAKAGAAILSGSIAGMSLEQGLVLVKRIAPFEHRISGGELWIKVN